MKYITILIIFTLIISCNKHYVSEQRVLNDTISGALEPFDTLAAYRKRPGKPKTVKVKGYTRKDGKVVKEHYRTERE